MRDLRKKEASKNKKRGYLFTDMPLSLRATGLEPARHRHQNLNLARLPIPPHPRKSLIFCAFFTTPDFNFIDSDTLARTE